MATTRADATGNTVYFAGLDGLRFVAAYAVLVHHVEQTIEMHGGHSWFAHPVVARIGIEAVHFFFVLSGYLITYLLLLERRRTGRVAVRQFYLRRVLRIWPLYYLVVVVGLVLGPLVPQLAWPGAYRVLDVRNPTVVLLYLVILPNAVWRFFGVLPHAAQLWSIGIEEQFYLAWPLVVGRTRRPLLAIAGVFVLFPGLRLALALVRRTLDVDMTTLPWRIVVFVGEQPFHCMAIGAVAAVLHASGALAPGSRWASRLFAPWLRLTVRAFVCTALLAPIELPHALEWVMPLGYAFVCLDVSAAPPGRIRFDGPRLRWLGRISYGIYMYHSLVIAIVLHAVVIWWGIGEGHPALRPLVYGLSSIATVGVAALSHRFFEGPLLALKRRYEVVHTGAR